MLWRRLGSDKIQSREGGGGGWTTTLDAGKTKVLTLSQQVSFFEECECESESESSELWWHFVSWAASDLHGKIEVNPQYDIETNQMERTGKAIVPLQKVWKDLLFSETNISFAFLAPQQLNVN